MCVINVCTCKCTHKSYIFLRFAKHFQTPPVTKPAEDYCSASDDEEFADEEGEQQEEEPLTESESSSHGAVAEEEVDEQDQPPVQTPSQQRSSTGTACKFALVVGLLILDLYLGPAAHSSSNPHRSSTGAATRRLMEMVAVRGGKKGAAGRRISTGMAYSMTVPDPDEEQDDDEETEQQPSQRSTGKRNRVAAPAGGSPTRRRGDPVARAAMQVQQHFATDPNAIAEVELITIIEIINFRQRWKFTKLETFSYWQLPLKCTEIIQII